MKRTGASTAPEIGCGEQFSIRSERENAGPGVRMRGSHIFPTESGVAAADAARGCSGGDPVHSDAADQ